MMNEKKLSVKIRQLIDYYSGLMESGNYPPNEEAIYEEIISKLKNSLVVSSL